MRMPVHAADADIVTLLAYVVGGSNSIYYRHWRWSESFDTMTTGLLDNVYGRGEWRKVCFSSRRVKR